MFSDYILRLDAAQQAAMVEELDRVVERWRRETSAKPSAEAREVLLYLYPVPLPRTEEKS